LQVDTEDYSNEVGTLQTAAQSFTKVDGALVRLFLGAPVVLQPEKVGPPRSAPRWTARLCACSWAPQWCCSLRLHSGR